MQLSGNSIALKEKMERMAVVGRKQNEGEKEKSMRIKNNRPGGQGEREREAQGVVVPWEYGYKRLGYLPAIPAQLPKIADVFRTTSAEKGLTVCSPR
jgi:hypothetical protein